MTITRLWAFLAVGLPTLAGLIAGLQTVDLAYHLRAGAEILDRGAIPAVDTWTFTAIGAAWTDQQWGAQVLFAAVFRLTGWTGLVVLRAALYLVIFGSLFLVCRRRGLGMRAAAWLTLGAFLVAAPALALRPQLVGMALFALVLLIVAERRGRPRVLWLVPLLVVPWANVHGSFFLAPVLLGLAWLEDVHDRVGRPHLALVVAVVSAVAACLTPFGPAVWVYAAGLTSNPQVRERITEWQPTSITSLTGLLFYGSVVLVAAALVRRRGRRGRTPWPSLVALGVFVIIGAYAERGVAWWPLVAVATMAPLLGAPPRPESPHRPERRESRSMRRLNAVVAGLIVLVGLLILPLWRPVDPRTGAPRGVLLNAPPGLTAAVRATAQPGDRLLNPQVWGSWFEFAVPDVLVAVDSRVELVPPAVWDAYDGVVRGDPGWEEQLAAWGVTLAVVAAQDEALFGRLSGAGWASVFADGDGWVVVAPRR